jgi:serine phosphatase RsbU (regulator of sigma subunit)
MLLFHGGQVELLKSTGLPLAIIEGMSYSQERRQFGPGDVLLLFSDGVSEAPRGHGFYGEERLQAVIEGRVAAGDGAESIGRALLADVTAYAGERLATDDVTIVVVKRRGEERMG